MTKQEEEIVWKFLFSLAAISGDLACTTSDDKELKKWFSVGAAETRNNLMKAQDVFMKEIGLKNE